MSKHFKASVFFQESAKDHNAAQSTKSKPRSLVLSCLAMFYSKVFARSKFDVCIIIITVVFFLLSVGISSFLIELYMPLRSVSLM